MTNRCTITYNTLFVFTGKNMPYVDKSFIYVIVDTAKNNMRKTEYKISNFVTGDAWVKLKRSRNKSGIEFRLLRKVLDPTAITETDDKK